MPDLDDGAIAKVWDEADSANPQPTIAYFGALLDEHPGDARALYEYASSLDFAGREAEAAPVYEQAFDAGLDGELHWQAMIQYGSTLRNLARHDEAVAVLRRAEAEYPHNAGVKAFLALALTGAGRGEEAVAGLVELAVDRIEAPELRQYARPLRAYAAELRGQGA